MANVDTVIFPDPKDRTPTILVVDDEVLIRMALSDYLQECGFKVLEAGTASEAIAVLKASESPIDLVISDVVMPGEMDGFGLAQWIRASQPGLPCLLVSGDSRKAETATEVCEKEAFLPKPYDLKILVARIRSMIDARKKK
jgi:DNA-binding response OmpR family regulator